MKHIKKFVNFNESVDYEKVYKEFKLTNQQWFAELKSGYILDCGFGLVENEFTGDTWFNIGKLVKDELPSTDGYYCFDETLDLVNRDEDCKRLEDLDYEKDSHDDSFCLIPKNDVIKTWFEIVKAKKPLKIGVDRI